eukprot:4440406-Amphidinium_carterae.1
MFTNQLPLHSAVKYRQSFWQMRTLLWAADTSSFIPVTGCPWTCCSARACLTSATAGASVFS